MFSPEILAALRESPELLAELMQADLSAAHILPLLTQLRKSYPPEIAAAALETARLRQKATAKFSRAADMFFTSEALQQASHEIIARHHAQKLNSFDRVADLGCGIGGDMLAHTTPVTGIDLDSTRLHMARHNANVYGVKADFVQADLAQPLPFNNIPAAFFDPARRDERKRLFSVRDYRPPLDIIQAWPFDALLVKVSPGVQIAEIAYLGAGIEFISHDGELKEALLHFGQLQFSGRQATILPEGETLVPLGYEPPSLTDAPRRYLYEPDPAVIRAGLFSEMLAHLSLNAYRLDEDIAYLTGDEWIESGWLRAWRIDDWMPFHLKKLRKVLRGKNIGQITVKKRGSPISPEQLQHLLHLKGNQHATVILTQLHGQPIVLLSYG